MKTSRDLGSELRRQGGGQPRPRSPPARWPSASSSPGAQEAPARSQWALFLRRFLRHRLAVGSLLVLVVLYLIVSFPHVLAPVPPQPEDTGAHQGADREALLGTDDLGRDQLTRVIYAAHISMTIGLLVAVFSTVIGTLIGSVAGYFGGWVDQLLMRVTDLFLIVPAIAVIAMAQQGLENKTSRSSAMSARRR